MSHSLLTDLTAPVPVDARNVEELALKWKQSAQGRIRLGTQYFHPVRVENALIEWHQTHRSPLADPLIGVRPDRAAHTDTRRYLDTCTARVSLELSGFVLLARKRLPRAAGKGGQSIVRNAQAFDYDLQRRLRGSYDAANGFHNGLIQAVAVARSTLPQSLARRPTLDIGDYDRLAGDLLAAHSVDDESPRSILAAKLRVEEAELRTVIFGNEPVLGVEKASFARASGPRTPDPARPTAPGFTL